MLINLDQANVKIPIGQIAVLRVSLQAHLSRVERNFTFLPNLQKVFVAEFEVYLRESNIDDRVSNPKEIGISAMHRCVGETTCKTSWIMLFKSLYEILITGDIAGIHNPLTLLPFLGHITHSRTTKKRCQNIRMSKPSRVYTVPIIRKLQDCDWASVPRYEDH